jgi:hypothetical protein
LSKGFCNHAIRRFHTSPPVLSVAQARKSIIP